MSFFRFVMVLSSLGPLFVLWAFRGMDPIPNLVFVPACVFLAIVPSAILYLRYRLARENDDTRLLAIGPFEDNQKHLLHYLFTTLLPLYQTTVHTLGDVVAALLALALIVFLFVHLRLHHINLLFAFRGYRSFTVFPIKDDNPYSGREPFVLLCRRPHLRGSDRIVAYHITDFLYLEVTDDSQH